MKALLPLKALLPISLTALGLAACNPSTPEKTTEAPPPAEAAPVPAPATTPASALPSVTYACTPAMALSVVYDNAAGPDGQARVTLDGREYVLNAVQSGSGARYETQNGRTAGSTLVWWNKGEEGMLLEGKTADPDGEETTLAKCSQTPAG